MTEKLKQGSVVVGVDGSVGSDAALEWAVRHATARRRPLVLVHGAGDPTTAAEWVGMDEALRGLEAAARQVTEHASELVATLAPDLEVHVVESLTDARSGLLELAADASIVVVGTRGRGPVRALLLGSVSTAVAAHAPCPVAVVRPSDRDAGPSHGGLVVGTDGGPASTAALEFAFDLASVEGRVLHAVHTWSLDDAFIDPASTDQRTTLMDEHKLVFAESLAGYAEKHPDVTVERHMPGGGAVQTLVEMSQGASAVVIGSRGRTGLRALLGSVSREVVERAHCTVVVVHP